MARSERAIRDVFLVQPIHAAGVDRLRQAGLAVRQASAPDMATVAAEVGQAEAVVTRNAGLSAAAMDAAPRLRLVVVHGIGHDPVDLAHATLRGLVVCNTPVANAGSVAEHAVMLLLAAARQATAADRAVREGAFDRRYTLRLTELRGKTLGIVGCGRIGLATARIARAGLGMRIIGYSPSADPARLRRLRVEPAPDLASLLAHADAVSLHVPLRPDTRSLLGRAQLALMKPGALLVNTARGALVDQAALVEALAAGRLAAAGLDVFAPEPLPAGDPLLALPNVVLSPHVAGVTEEAMARTAEAVATAILRVAAGRPAPHRIPLPGTSSRA